MASTISDWLSFFDHPHSIYVNARHKDAHYRLIAEQICQLMPSPQARVLDYGCGEALHADRVAAIADAALLCDAAPGVRTGLKARFADNSKIRVLAPDQVPQLTERSLDLIILHSVAQYLTDAEMGAIFQVFHRLLRADGVLIVGDVVQPDSTVLTAAVSLLRFAAANHFIMAALVGLIRMAGSDYRRLRKRLGITRYDEAAMIKKLAAAGFTARCAPGVIGHDCARLAFIARPAISGAPS